MKNIKFEKFQIDYLKLSKSALSNEINWENLIPHPVLVNHYTLNPKLTENAKNFSLYFKNNVATIKLSVPYFLKGHNYQSISKNELLEVRSKLKKWLNIDITYSTADELEFGAFELIDLDSVDYIKNIIGVNNFELERHTPHFKMFGNVKKKFHYKIYDAVANSKSKKTFTKGNYPKDRLIKHELKFENTKKYFNYDVYFIDLYDTPSIIDYCNEKIFDLRKNLICKEELSFNPIKGDLSHILYTALKNVEQQNTKENMVKLLFDLVDQTNLSSSQKSKRRKSITLLEEAYNQEFNNF